jgi:hypothetical protein
VGEHARRDSLARVRGHEHLSVKGLRGAAGPAVVKSRVVILPRSW